MKVLFCLPHMAVSVPAKGINYRPTLSLPLGVLLMAAYLRDQKWPGIMEIYDARLSGKTYDIPDVGRFFGDRPEEIEDRIAKSGADVIAISNMWSWQIDCALEVAEIAKRVNPKIVTVLGGPHASSFPEEMVEHPQIDFVVMGEGEERLHMLLKCLEQEEVPEIQGVLGRPEDMSLLRPNKKVPIDFIEPLDELPLPAYDLVDVDRYFALQSSGFSPRTWEGGQRVVSLLTSRGCPHQCVFCSIQATMGYKWREHSPEYVRRHIEMLTRDFQVDYIHFEDDNFTHDPSRYDRILDELLAMDKQIKWDTPNGVRGDTWTFDRVKRTQDSGCQYLVVAIESAVQRVVDEVVKKRLDLSQCDDLMKYCHELKLKLMAFYVIGLPGETLPEVKQTVDYALDRYERFNAYPSIGMAIALPGTELHDTVMESNLYTGEGLQYKPNEIVTPEFNPEALKKLYDEAMSKKLALFVKKSLMSPKELLFNLRYVIGYQTIVRRHWRSIVNFGKSAMGNLFSRKKRSVKEASV